MKYFTREIWAGWQSTDKAVFNRAMKEWNTNRAQYLKSLAETAARLGAEQKDFFVNDSLHDGRLLRFRISDWPASNLKGKNKDSRTAVELVVLDGWTGKVIYNLFYSGIEEISIRTRNDLFPLPDSRFGDWGYDELLAESPDLFRHNILFQTGTEISILFREFRIKKQKATSKVLRHYATGNS